MIIKKKYILTSSLFLLFLLVGNKNIVFGEESLSKDELAPLKILRHVQGLDKITNSATLNKLDINLDGQLTEEDADIWLQYLSDTIKNPLAIETRNLPTANLNAEYSVKLSAVRGSQPYKWTLIKGSLPSGLKLNSTTGEITGTPKKEGESKFTLKVTDADKYTASREFSISVVNTNISSVKTPNPVTVEKGETPNLPSQVTVVYKDNSTGKEYVDWDYVDTSTAGKKVLIGKLTKSGIAVSIEVIVVDSDVDDSEQVQAIASVSPIKVLVKETPNLPSSVAVTYKDGSVKMEKVTWGSVDTKTLGTKTVKGTIDNLNLSIETKVTVVADKSELDEYVEPILSVDVKYIGILDLHSIVINTIPDVYAVKIEASVYNSKNKLEKVSIPMHYDPIVSYDEDGEPIVSSETRFTLATPRLIPNSEITIVSYDKFNNELGRKAYKLNSSN